MRLLRETFGDLFKHELHSEAANKDQKIKTQIKNDLYVSPEASFVREAYRTNTQSIQPLFRLTTRGEVRMKGGVSAMRVQWKE